ncbi:hypothetical protein ACA910_002838 [Epithemia clementina (nom. ined.)]
MAAKTTRSTTEGETTSASVAPDPTNIKGDTTTLTAPATTATITRQAPETTAPPVVELVPDGDEKSMLLVKQKNINDVSSNDDEINNTKNVVIALLWAIAVLSALDRVAMAVALVPMSEEFGFTDGVKGSISSLFSVGYGLFILPSGLLVASVSPRFVMACGIVIWSLATMATPGATGLGGTMALLLVARACVGAAESVVMPTLQRLLASWTKPDEKSAVMATIFAGFHGGTIAAYVLSPLIIDWFGSWREIFLVYGTFGIALLVPWLVFARDGPNDLKLPSASATDNSSSMAGEPVSTFSSKLNSAIGQFKEAPWKDFFQSKGTWAMLLAHCSKNWGLYNTLAWTPTFYYEQYGIGVRDSIWLSVLPSISGAIGGLVAGNLADGVIRNLPERTDEALTNVRKVFQSIALYGPALTMALLASNIPEDPQIAQFFLMAVVGFQAFVVAGFEAGNQEKAGTKWAGLLYSITSLPAVCVGTFGVWCVGQVLDATGQDWSIVFYMNAFVNVLGATAFLALYNSKREFD